VTRTTRRQNVPRKNLALLRWLRRFTAEPDDRGEQWWHEFETLLRQTRTRLRPIDA
jgi:hypothetical protein